ncbi:DUF2515 domain-containing protein [Pseudalkalibacillus caeni]|uniref:DUF2515 domain-containing protein n=1 Tax=Exobacillus caeni TaxID=2574798 RepID=A0A5R9F5W6_9BACL|nr:DUF2515 domain-containing protein [Pseudalkalibacillus caeni]TLS35874.1 DUF2515 domain-containing protein [Pseudalkalibacillus caeni]
MGFKTSLNSYSKRERAIIQAIIAQTERGNVDNISRTAYYQAFYKRNPEIMWAFLASMVSRNAGWSMTDLQGKWFPRILPPEKRQQLFFTYERANWLIFSDAFPQLLLYEKSKHDKKGLFHLLSALSVSTFMHREWELFWNEGNRERLCTSLIINEQNIIQKPVLEHAIYEGQVFRSIPFRLQDIFHFSTVIFPTVDGELYGFSVSNFRKLSSRIELGRKLSWLLFHPNYVGSFHTFAYQNVHTGSRFDYERYLGKSRESPFLRMEYPVVTHTRLDREDWFKIEKQVIRHYKPLSVTVPTHLTDWYKTKQKQIKAGILLKEIISD